MTQKSPFRKLILLFLALALLAGCTSGLATGVPNTGKGGIKLTLDAYSTPREAYKELIPLFEKQWKDKSGQDITFEESYLGSGAQSRAIVIGFEADVTALSLEGDITSIQDAGLITHYWQSGPQKGIVSTSVVAFAVRPGNPKGIHDWADLAKPGVEVLTPNPSSSGGAMWNILALYGAAKRGYVSGVAKDDDAAAKAFLVAVLKNVKVLDKDARTSINTFASGVGDVAITYENEVLVGKQSGQKYDLVIPRSTILIENPVAVVDTYVDKHNTRAAAEAFVAFLFTPQAQQVFAKYGQRSIDPRVAKSTASMFPKVEDQFTIQYFGGWKQAKPAFFGDSGIYTQAIAQAQGNK